MKESVYGQKTRCTERRGKRDPTEWLQHGSAERSLGMRSRLESLTPRDSLCGGRTWRSMASLQGAPGANTLGDTGTLETAHSPTVRCVASASLGSWEPVLRGDIG